MERMEYQVKDFPNDNADVLESFLNEKAEDGWELVAVVPRITTISITFVFKRQRKKFP